MYLVAMIYCRCREAVQRETLDCMIRLSSDTHENVQRAMTPVQRQTACRLDILNFSDYADGMNRQANEFKNLNHNINARHT